MRGRTAYDLIFRVDRPLPRTASGRIEASLGGYGVAGSLANFGRHTTHACYAAGLTISRHHAPHAHRLYPLTLRTQEPGLPTTHGHSTLRRYRNFVDMLTRASRELGC